MKKYITPSVISNQSGNYAIPALIAGLSIAKAFAAGAAVAVGSSLLKGDKSVSIDTPAGLEPIYAS